VHTITADNGSEFFGNEYVAEKLKADIYFANPPARHGIGDWTRTLTDYYASTSGEVLI